MSALGIVAAIGLMIAALVMATSAMGRAARVERELLNLKRLLQEREEMPGPTEPERTEPEPDTRPAVPVPDEEETPSPEPQQIREEPAEAPATHISKDPIAETPGAAAPASGDVMASQWMVWVGGIALALGGVFLVKYSIDQGLLSPAIRILLGVITGLAMVGVGEYARRHPLPINLGGAGPDHLPGIVTAAGVITLFAVTYTAYALYNMIPGLVAFALLAAVAVGALALSLLHGPALAALGLIGSMLVPLLVASEQPSAIGLFTYLAVLAALLVATGRFRRWWWLAWSAIYASGAWVLIWMANTGESSVALGLFIAFLGVLPLTAGDKPPEPKRLFDLETMDVPEYFVWTSCVGALVLAFFFVRLDDYGPASIALAVGLAGAHLWTAWRHPARHIPLCGAAILAVVTIATWPVSIIPAPVVADPELAPLNPVEAPEFSRFVIVACLFGVLFAVAGFLAAARQHIVGLWAGLSAAVPTLILFFAYWRWTAFESDFLWALTALVLAGIMTVAAERRAFSRPALGAYAVATVACLSMAVAMILREAWLTAALSLLLPAVAAISIRLELKALRWVALAAAGVVLVRLLVNPSLLDYQLVETPILNWLLYGYGVPALAFYASAKLFLREQDDLTVQILEAGAIAFLACLVSFQIRHLISGQLDSPYNSLLEMSLQTAAWLAISYGLYARQAFASRMVFQAASQILRIVGALHLVVFQLGVYNPLVRAVDVGDWPMLNVLTLAYLVPAAFALLFSRAAQARNDIVTTRVAGLFTLVLVFVYLTLEVRHLFQGPFLNEGDASQAEQYTYSAVWLVFGAALLALGVWRSSRDLRNAAFAMLMLTTAKVFIFDMSGLEGVLRAGSFLGLGAALVGLSYLYRRLTAGMAPSNVP